MTWDQIDKASVDAEASSKRNEEYRQKTLELAKAYSKCFSGADGKRVLEDLSGKFIYGNDTPFSSPNINYEAAYHDGEAGVVKFIINQMQHAQLNKPR